MASHRGILLLGAYRQSLAVARALGPQGWRISLGAPSTQTPSFIARSKWVREAWFHPPLDASTEGFLDALSSFLERHPDTRFVLPVGDSEVTGLNAIRSLLPQSVSYIMPNSKAIDTCADKNATLRLAMGLGVPVAAFARVECSEQLLEAAGRVGYPCVVKPITEETRVFGAKAVIATEQTSLRQMLATRPRPTGPFVVQRYVRGERHCLYFYATQGIIRAAAQVLIGRTDREDDTGYAVTGVSVPIAPEWLDHLTHLVTELEYDGFGCLQYLIDPETGDQTFLEINARLGGNHAGLERLGMHQVQWAIEQTESGRPSIPEPFEYPIGVRYRWFTGDLMGFIHDRRVGHLTGRAALQRALALPSTLFGSGHLTFDWRDPAPTVHQFAQFSRPIRRRIRLTGNQAKRVLSGAALGACRERRKIWQDLLTAARSEGIEPDALPRVYDYVSTTLRTRAPRYATAIQRPSRYFPGLTAIPIHDPAQFEWRSLLEENFPSIREEILGIRECNPFRPHHQNLADQGTWDTLYFFTGNKRIEQTHALCPRTGQLVEQLPRAGNDGQVYLSALSGNTHIKAHCGPTNVRLRCHFGIRVPRGSRLRVGSEIVKWQEGRCLFFDDSFEHEVWNFGGDERIVLILDFWHPDLTAEERWAIERLSESSEAIERYQRSIAG
jgi:predicted ATP-grasp superfamily ATP-dependent carboligase